MKAAPVETALCGAFELVFEGSGGNVSLFAEVRRLRRARPEPPTDETTDSAMLVIVFVVPLRSLLCLPDPDGVGVAARSRADLAAEGGVDFVLAGDE